MGLKTDFLSELNADLPDGVGGLLDKAIPAAPSVATPTDVDSAIIAQGVLAKYLLDLFDTFRGLTPIELLLRIGQKNATLQAALLAGLEYVEKTSFEYEILSPSTSGTYYPEDENQFSAELETQEGFEACIGIVATIPELSQTIVLERIDDMYAYRKNTTLSFPVVSEFPMSLTARFSATFEGAELYAKTVNFEVSAPL
jgi:hypothetical protein